MARPPSPDDVRARARRLLAARADPRVKQSYEQYFLGAVQFLGLKTPNVKIVARELLPVVDALDEQGRIHLAFDLLRSPYMEERQLGTVILQRMKKKLPDATVDELAALFDEHVHDWASCDQLAGRILREMILRPSTRRRVMAWSKARSPWRQRAAAVAFVNEARHGRFDDDVIEVCARIVKNPHRFVQLGAGWVLRELSLADRARVLAFLDENAAFISREGLRYAIEKVPKKLREEVLARKRPGAGATSRRTSSTPSGRPSADGRSGASTTWPRPRRAARTTSREKT